MPVTYEFAPWAVECLPEDGARLSHLVYKGHNLLTTAPDDFVPVEGFGDYEARPVYGYDDCFPTVDACQVPDSPAITAPDHGELCWLPWRLAVARNILTCSVASRLFEVDFRRALVFAPNGLEWRFEVENRSARPLPFLHVMHALMPPAEIASIQLPAFSTLFDEARGTDGPSQDPSRVAAALLTTPRGAARMLLLRGVGAGRFGLKLRSGLSLEIHFPRELFPTLGIWWNNCGYPGVRGRERAECAFEPIPGSSSSLEVSAREGRTLVASPRSTLSWSVKWRVV
jgi:hypothetical protein